MKAQRAKNGGTDAYFTKPELAARYVDLVNQKYPLSGRLCIEPSAGDGSFLNALMCFPDVIAYDLEPKTSGIQKADFFSVSVETELPVAVIGNPPFGFAANMAIKFFNHAARFADVIAFIVPRSFQKSSVHNKLDPRFHCVFEEICPKNSFLVDGEEEYDVPCVFQIWEKQSQSRLILTVNSNPYFDFTTQNAADFCIRRVGGRTGEYLVGLEHNENTTYFCKAKRKDAKKAVLGCQLAFKILRDQTAGVRSLSKSEINAVLTSYHAGAIA